MVLFQTGFSLAETVDYLVNLGVYDVLLPFLLIFAIMFAILEKTEILGRDKSNINVIVSVVIGLLLIVQKGIVEIINLFLPRVSLIIVVLLMGLLVISMLAGNTFKGLKGTTLGVAMVLVVIALIFALTSQPGTASWLSQADKEALIRVGVPIAIFLIVIALVTAKPKKENKPGFFKTLAKEMGGGEE